MPPSLSRRKKGLILGFSLMSAAALVAFGTARYMAGKKRTSPEATGEDGAETGEEPPLEEQSLWERVSEIGRAALLLFSNRKMRA